MNKTYLFIGADGATGSIITEEFQKWFFGKIIAPKIQELDYRRTDQILFYLREFQPDVVFLVGAYTNVDKAESEDKKLCWEINQDGIENFLITLLQTQKEKLYKNIPKIIYISTDMVGSGDVPLSENEDVWSTVRAKNEYGKSKLGGEKILRDVFRQFFNTTKYERNVSNVNQGFSYHIVRIATPFSGLRKGSFLTLLYNNQNKNIRLVADQLITPTFAEDLAWNLHLIAEYGNKEIYHDAVSDEKQWSVYDAGVKFGEICGWDASKIEKMSFREMYEKNFWRAPRGKSNELIVKNLLTLPSPTPPKISTMEEVLKNFKKKYINL